MSDNTSKTIQIGPGLPALMFLAFLVLKLTNTITWSWWWVTVPLWGSAALFVAVVVAVGAVWLAIHGIAIAWDVVRDWIRNK